MVGKIMIIIYNLKGYRLHEVLVLHIVVNFT